MSELSREEAFKLLKIPEGISNLCILCSCS